jgi:HEAT repeat protein
MMEKNGLKVDSEEKALAILRDKGETISRREAAARYLELKESEEAVRGMIEAMDDDDFGVRWAVSTALAKLGERVLSAVLGRIIHGYNTRLRESVYHVLHYNRSKWVQANARELMEALKSPAPGVTAPEAAYELLEAFQKHRQAARKSKSGKRR